MINPFALSLRQYQDDINADVEASFAAGSQNVCAVLPTGAGKTIVKAHRACVNYVAKRKHIVFAHRDFLLVQISMSLAKMGVKHTFIASDKTVRYIGNLHVEKLGFCMIDDTSPVCVASVGAFIRRPFAKMVAPSIFEWNLDETHHLLRAESEEKGGIWGRAVNMCHNARGVGVTATPIRGDGKGLGRDAFGVFDDMVVGVGMRDLIKMGNLTPFRVFAPPHDALQDELAAMRTTAGGDYNQKKLAKAVDKPTLTGDAVDEYQRIAMGERAITYCVDIEHCKRVADEFNAAGIPSRVLSSRNTDTERQKGLEDFENGVLWNLVNCDLFGEGFDLPAVTTGIMLRPTKSYGLYVQQFGRVLRPMEGKTRGKIIDHVGNFWQHGRPDEPPEWNLDGEYTGSGKKSEFEDRLCPECHAIYRPVKPSQLVCTECDHEETPDEQAAAVRRLRKREGTLIELDFNDYAEVEARLTELAEPDQAFRHKMRNAKGWQLGDKIANDRMRHVEAVKRLQTSIQKWCEVVSMQTGWTPAAIQAHLGSVFGTHPVKAQILPEKQANQLNDKIREYGYNMKDLRL